MGLFDNYFSYSAVVKTSGDVVKPEGITVADPVVIQVPKGSIPNSSAVRPQGEGDGSSNPRLSSSRVKEVVITTQTTGGMDRSPEVITQVNVRRFSFRSFGFVRKDTVSKTILSTSQEHHKRSQAMGAASKRVQKAQSSKADRRAHESALAVRTLIIGPTLTAQPQLTKTTVKPQLSDVKSQLMKPKTANKVIQHLRHLPSVDQPSAIHGFSHCTPIHAVCLEHTELEEHQLHFSKLVPSEGLEVSSTPTLPIYDIKATPLDALTRIFNEMRIVNLINSPDFGLGQPGDGDGILAGALPTAETVLDGVKQITPQLMALGYATGKAITPDHSGIYPPTDRMSVLTYWWGLEVLLPPPTLAYLGNAQSITSAVVNFLTALSLVNNGVREILPFVRYIAQFIDFEFSSIQKQDEGQGVVCAATWIMPAALVPRPWDFPSLPQSNPDTDPNRKAEPGSVSAPTKVAEPQAVSSRPINSFLDTLASPIKKSSAVTPALTKQP